MQPDGKVPDTWWIDIKRVTVSNGRPVMLAPDYAKGPGFEIGGASKPVQR